VPKWVWYSILTMVLWGVWGIVSKVAMEMMSPLLNQVLFTLGLAPLVLVTALSRNASVGTNPLKGGAHAFATGILGAVGNVTFFIALSSGGKASIVVPMTGLYPLLTILTALPLLRETLNRVQILGVVLAVAAILLFSAG
jgi:transporter family protein